MAGIINPGSPVEFQIQQQALERQRAIAQELQKQSMTPDQGQMVSGHYVAPSSMQYLAKLAQGLIGKQQGESVDKSQIDLAAQQNKFMGDQAATLSKALAANPEDDTSIVNYLNATGNSGKSVDYVIANAKQKALANALMGTPQGSPPPAPATNEPGPSGNVGATTLRPSAPPLSALAPQSPTAQQQTVAPQQSAQSVPAPTTQQGAFQLLPPEQQQIVMAYVKSGKPEEGVKAMQDYLKPHITADGRVVVMRNGRVGVPEGSVAAYKGFQSANKEAENANTLAAPEYVKNPDGTITPKTVSQVINGTKPASSSAYQGQDVLAQLPDDVRSGVLEDARKSGSPQFSVNYQLPNGRVVSGKVDLAGAVNEATSAGQTTSGKQQQEKQGAFFGDTYADIQKKGMAANDSMSKYTRLNQLLEGIDTGKFTGTALEIKKAAKSAGIDLGVSDNVAPLEAARALTSEMALIARNPDSGMGMPGAMSDADRNFLTNMQPGIETTPDGRKLQINALMKMEQRKQEIAKLAREYKNGQLDNGFFQAVQEYANAHPLFEGMSVPNSKHPSPAQPKTGAPNYQDLYGIKVK